jgi:CBS domain-containing protein
MRVEQVMTRTVETCGPHDHLDRAAQLMWDYDCGVVPVVNGEGAQRVIGMITDRDVCMAAYTQGRPLSEIAVATAMSQRLCSCRTTDAVAVALKVMETNQVRRLPVLDADDRLVGVLSLADLGREAAREHGQADVALNDAAIGEALEAIAKPHAAGELPVAKA